MPKGSTDENAPVQGTAEATTRWFVDIEPLRRFPHFRRLWTGYIFRQLGSQLTIATVLYQVFKITHSNFDVGLVSLIQVVPGICGSILGGAIADAFDRKKVLIVTASLISLCTVGLAINGMLARPQLWPLFVCSTISWALTGVDMPTRNAAQISLVDKEYYVQANVLRNLLQQSSIVLGPSLAGLLLGITGGNFAVVYWIDVLAAFAALQALLRIPSLRPQDGGRKFSLGSIGEGFTFLKSNRTIFASVLLDLNANVLGLPTALYPYMASVHFHGGPFTYGLLSTAPGIGAVLGSIVSGWFRRIRYIGRAVVLCIVLWGVTLSGFGLAPWLPLGVVLLALAGWANAVSAALRNTMLQLETPDRMRGRLTAFSSAFTTSGPRIGNAESGFVAALTNAQFSIVSGGLGCIVGTALIVKLLPGYWTYTHEAFGERDA